MFVLLSCAIAPALALLSYFYLRREIAEEPSRLLLHTFIYGAILTFPIMFIQHVLNEEHLFTSLFFRNVLVTSTLEEFFKWLIIIVALYKHVEFDDPYDGILYGASVSLGFATVENILYLLNYGMGEAFLRALLPVSSHALFGVVMGYYIGRAKFTSIKKIRLELFFALIAPLFLHIIYNSILTFTGLEILLMVPFMLFLWVFGLSKVKQTHILSRRTRFEKHEYFIREDPN
ncbi:MULTISPECIES: glutamic-type intramembrane protease PrsW [unclassified Psychrobacillus]|uniref:glutamic-type intramembrane protease PrsW n=1 Tax=unclassified Psychrobacillus TaxID=2636677 RepID=UPI00146DA3C0|nr:MULTISPECIES: glutamic-type intramembrane protease PrsW [unclassified Psychrobacillus]MCM3358824.1 glutamic-type intramembrane protease PrsW [Psychrobacillus sp. MER TA 171]NME05867.1 intramembrane metalloprotease PrsW [Psychrobacillus sp. BL-248-WT-3]